MSLLNVDSLKAVSGDTILIQSNVEMAPGKTFNAAGTGTSTVTLDNITGLATAVIGKPYTFSFVATTSLVTSGGSITDFYIIRPDGVVDSVTANTGTGNASYTLAGSYVTGSAGGSMVLKVRAKDSNGNVSAWETKTVNLIQINVLAPTVSVGNSTAVAKTGLNATIGGIALSETGYIGSSARIDWEVRSLSGGNGVSLASGTVNNPASGTYSLSTGAMSLLEKNTAYFLRAKHIDAAYGEGAWGEVGFTTLDIAFSSTFPTVAAPNQTLSVTFANKTSTVQYAASSSLGGSDPIISGTTLTYTVPLSATGSFTITVTAGGFSVIQTLQVSSVTVNAPSSVTIAGGTSNVPTSFTFSTSALTLSSNTVTDTLREIQWRIRAVSGATTDAIAGTNASSYTSDIPVNTSSALTPGTAYILYVKHVGTTYGASAELQVPFTTLDFSISGTQPSAASMYKGGNYPFTLSTPITSPVFTAALTYPTLGTATVTGGTVTVSPTSAGSNGLIVTLGGFSKSFTFTVQDVGLNVPTLTSTASGITSTPTFTISSPTLSVGTANHTKTDWELYDNSGYTGTAVWSSTNNTTNKTTITISTPGINGFREGNYHLRVRWYDGTQNAWSDWTTQTLTTFSISLAAAIPSLSQGQSTTINITPVTGVIFSASSTSGTVGSVLSNAFTYTAPSTGTTGSFTVSGGGLSKTFSVTVTATTVNQPTVSSSQTVFKGTTNSFTIASMTTATAGVTATPTKVSWYLYDTASSTTPIWQALNQDLPAGTGASYTATLDFSTATGGLQPNTTYYLKAQWTDATFGSSVSSMAYSFPTFNISLTPALTSLSQGQTQAFTIAAVTGIAFTTASVAGKGTAGAVSGSAFTYTAPMTVSAAGGQFTVSGGGLSKTFTYDLTSVTGNAPTITGTAINLGITGSSFTVSGMTLPVGTAAPTHLAWELFSDSACTLSVWTSGDVAVGTVTNNSATQAVSFSNPTTPIQMGGTYYLKVKWRDSTYGYSTPSNALTLTMLDIKVGGVTALTAYEGQSKAFSLDTGGLTYTATGATISGSTVTYAAALGATSGSFTVSSKDFTQPFSVTIQDVSVVTPTITVTGLNVSNEITSYANVVVSSSAFAISPSAVTGVTDTLVSATWTLLDGTTSVWTGTGLTATIPATTFVFGKLYTLRLKHTGSKYGDSANAEQAVTFKAFTVTGASSVGMGESSTYTVSGYNSSLTYGLSVSSGGGSVSAISSGGTFTYTASSTAGTYTLTVTADGVSVATSVQVFLANDIGIAGSQGFGVGTYPETLPSGMTGMSGYMDKANDNYGNYQYTDGSVMVYIPKFYYRWGKSGTTPSALYNWYGDNSIEIKPASAFANEAAANAAGWGLHRAFIDGGNEKSGFWVDKYLWSATGTSPNKIASSIKNGNPLSSASDHNPFSGVTANGQTPANAYYGAFAVAKTRGNNFFPLSIFQLRALSMLSLAHAQACKVNNSIAYCAWGDLGAVSSTSPGNFPKGNNNNAFRDSNDSSVVYTSDGYSNCGKTGSGGPIFAKTTHNGQNCGVADLNGNMWQITPGLTSNGINFYVLKRSIFMKNLTGGNTTNTDAWGSAGIAAIYENVGSTIGSGATGQFGNGSARVFSEAIMAGNDHSLSCAGVPLVTSATGLAILGNDNLWYAKTNEMCPTSGGLWRDGANAGAWALYLAHGQSYSNSGAGGRSGLYPA